MTMTQATTWATLVLVVTAGCGEPYTTLTSDPDAASSTGDAVTETGGDPATTDVGPTTGDDSTTSEETTGEPTDPPVPPAYEQWLKVELPGTVCGNGSQYKFFVNYKEGAKDLMIMLEPGGACWDFDGCSGKSHLGAAHPNGIPDDLMSSGGQTANLSPLIRRHAVNEHTADWNMVFLPYCTGDVHTGNNVITYKDPSGTEPDLTFHHAGHTNIQIVTEWLAQQFPQNDRLFVNGCSAGGAGAIINYHFLRDGIPADRGYLMNDSGPIFPSEGYSAPLHTKIRESWNVDSIFTKLPMDFMITDDFGELNVHLADMYPDDRLSTVYFQRDYNYSRYSYERFYDDNTKADLMSYWAEDTKLLVNLYNERDNLGYYLPYWRELNDSHCVSIVAYLDTEIDELDMNLDDYIGELLDDNVPLGSYQESVQPDEDKD